MSAIVIKTATIKDRFSNCLPDRNGFNKKLFSRLVENADSFSQHKESQTATYRTFQPGDRYFYDFNMDMTQWMQMDTYQDAAYYGNWINPTLRSTLSYCEGDICLVIAENDKAFIELVRSSQKWQEENGYWIGIDPGLYPCKESELFLEKYKESV